MTSFGVMGFFWVGYGDWTLNAVEARVSRPADTMKHPNLRANHKRRYFPTGVRRLTL